MIDDGGHVCLPWVRVVGGDLAPEPGVGDREESMARLYAWFQAGVCGDPTFRLGRRVAAAITAGQPAGSMNAAPRVGQAQ